MIFVETLKKKNNNVKSSDDEFFSVDDLLEETPVDVQSIEVDTEVEEFIKKKN